MADPVKAAEGTGNPNPESVPGSDNLDWRAQLPEDLRSDKSLESIKGKDWTEAGPVLVKNYVNQQKFLGGSLRIPGSDAKPEEIAAFRTKLGVPETPDKYEIKAPTTKVVDAAGAEKEMPLWDEKSVTGFKEFAHRTGLTQPQVAALVDWYQGGLGNSSIYVQEMTVRAEKALKEEWGAAYEHKLARAQRAAELLGGAEVVGLFESSGLGSHPAVIKMFEKLGREMAEDGAILEDAAGPVGPIAAQAEIAAMLSGPKDSAFWNSAHAGHKAAVERYRELNQIVHS